jgi:hypothetical protein
MLVAGAYKGYQAKKLKEEEAKGLQEAAVRQMAITSREMAEEIRNKELMHSRAIAVAGLSGAGTDGLTKLLGDLNTEGEYRVMSVLWNGQNEAEGLIFRAEAARREGKAAQTAGIIDGVTSAISAYNQMGGKWGWGKGSTTVPGGTGPVLNTAPGTMYSPVPGGAPQLWTAPGTIPSAGLYSPVKPKTFWPG